MIGLASLEQVHVASVADFTYKTGETVRPEKPFSDDWTDECASGIHFFITREEAVDYNK
jgi:hypothetical protein